ncbi:MAG: nitrogen fixation protein NifQ [Polyangiales bacterium]
MSVSGEDVYRWLVTGSEGGLCQGFDKHVAAAILSLSLVDTQEGGSLVSTCGLTPAELNELAELCFPHAASVLSRVDPEEKLERPEVEACLQQLLFRGSTSQSRFEHLVSCMIARRAQRSHHLWQDLGLRHRRELSWLMQQHFEPLADRNTQDMKWKKFLYRMICRDESFMLCVAPSCEECDDVERCFGDENGPSLLSQSQQSS